jgi:Uma2 family endonuclease
MHGDSVSRLSRLLTEYQIKTGDNGSIYYPRAGIVKGPNSWLEPDMFYLVDATKTPRDPKYPQYLSTADLVVEVISPGSAIYDRNTKADTYAALGVRELWLIDEAAGIIEVRILKGNQYDPSVVLERDDYLRSSVLSGLEIKVGSVFGD